MNLDAFFPTIIGSVRNPDHSQIEKRLTDYCLKLSQTIQSGGQSWLSYKTYNTSNGKYELFDDLEFKSLTEWITKQVKEYCQLLNIEHNNLTNNGSWFNIYRKYDFQENHVHPDSTISTIYILNCSEDGARMFFYSPINKMYYVKKSSKSQEMVDTIICSSIPGNLIVFPSYLSHAVERHDTDNLRISLSYNFRQL